MLSPSAISFELHAKVAEEIDLEMCSYGQFVGSSNAPSPWPWPWIG